MSTKRKNGGDKGKAKKARYSKAQNIEPNWCGIYATCVRGHENQCRTELRAVLEDFAERLYGDALKTEKEQEYEKENTERNESNRDEGESRRDYENEKEQEKEQEKDIESEIAKELQELKDKTKSGKELFTSVDIDCECVVFFRIHSKVVVPSVLATAICEDIYHRAINHSRYTQRLCPVDYTATANLEGLRRVSKQVLAPHFHAPEGQEKLRFAIRPTIRNHNVLSRDDVIMTVAECVGRDHGHKVDLKNYDKMILVEVYKSSVGVAVVDGRYDMLGRFNLQKIFDNAIPRTMAEKENDGELGQEGRVQKGSLCEGGISVVES